MAWRLLLESTCFLMTKTRRYKKAIQISPFFIRIFNRFKPRRKDSADRLRESNTINNYNLLVDLSRLKGKS